MRWAFVALVFVVAAACGGGRGAVLVIHSKADRVIVYAAAKPCSIAANGTMLPSTDGIAQRVHAWPIDGRADCFVWQAHDGRTWTREMISPNKDHDCDGFDDGSTVECDDFWFRLKPQSGIGTCLTMDPSTRLACTVGTLTPLCTDGLGAGGGCAQLQNPTYCVPDAVCAG